jgi:hypothetical protein
MVDRQVGTAKLGDGKGRSSFDFEFLFLFAENSDPQFLIFSIYL